MTDGTFVAELERIAHEACGGEQLAPDSITAYRIGDRVELVDLTGDKYRDEPKRKVGTVFVRDVPSFDQFWSKHAIAGDSEVYADRERLTVTAVLDAHGRVATGWGGHRLVLKLQHSEAFKAWIERDGKLMTQEQFAEFIEDNRADVREPSAADMLEIAQTIQGTSKVEWQSGHQLSNGQRQIAYMETAAASAGAKGKLAIPAEIVIGVPVFEGAEKAHAIRARFRHRIEGGQLRLMFKLDRPSDVVTAAFDAAVDELGDACNTVVLRGSPA